MTTDVRQEKSFLRPTRIVALLALFVAILCGVMLVTWLSGPRTLTLEVTEPVGKVVAVHLVVDGRAESREGVAPLTLRFQANELRYAVVCLDAAPPSEVEALVHDASGTGGSRTAAGVTGSYRSAWWGTIGSMNAMTPTHVANMRKSVLAERDVNAAAEQP